MTQRFHSVEYQRRNGVAVVTMSNPPVNGLSHGVRLGLVEAFAQAVDDPHVCAVVLTGAGRVATAALEAIAGGLESADFDAGMKRAREIYDALSASDEVRRQRDRFLAARSGTDPEHRSGEPHR